MTNHTTPEQADAVRELDWAAALMAVLWRSEYGDDMPPDKVAGYVGVGTVGRKVRA